MNEIVSIIIPTFKRSQSIERTVRSVLSQTYSNIEILVIDDNGKENEEEQVKTELVVNKMISEDCRISYCKLLTNSGAVVARNKGISLSKGNYICFLDDDDTYLPSKIESQFNILNKATDKYIAFVKCEMTYDYGAGKQSTTSKSLLFDGNQLKNHIYSSDTITGTPTFLFKREPLVKIGGFVPTPIRQEYMLILELLSKGYRGVYNPNSLVIINSNLDGISVGRDGNKAEAIENVYNKRLEFRELFDENEISSIKKKHKMEMYRWYSPYDLSKSMNIVNDLLINREVSLINYAKLVILSLIKRTLGGKYYKIRNYIR